jgi:starch phosphorylase
MQNLFDKYLPEWFNNPTRLIDAPKEIPDDALWTHHQDAKAKLIRYVNSHLTAITSQTERDNPLRSELFDENTLTISLARRPVAYKRPLLLYHDIERFVRIGVGKIQVIQCGKSHPEDDVSQEFVRQIVRLSKKFKDIIRIAFLRNYSPRLARILVSGSDLWLNTPRRPLEASGTSGMKAAMNGCLNLSVLDGWWIEALRINPLSGFALGPDSECSDEHECDRIDAEDMYTKLEDEIIPLYYDHRQDWLFRMKQAISLGAYFNTHRVVKDYQTKAWNL